jgi:sec-independent protein translocase protein TatB
MLDMSWGEIMVIGAVALIVIGPKDLPKALRTVGQVTGKIRRMASEFQGQFAEAMREAELDDVKRQIQGVNDQVSSFNPVQTIRTEIKGAVEAPTAGTTPTGQVSAPVADQPPSPTDAPVLPEPDLLLPPVPPVSEPAETISVAVNTPAPAAAEPEAPPAAASGAKPTEKAQ